MAEKYSIYFNFGPNESYFFRGIAQTRSCGDIAGSGGEPVQWIEDWKKYDCVTWTSQVYFACRRKNDCVNRCRIAGFQERHFKDWAEARALSPLRLVIGIDPSNWFAWMLHGDFLSGPGAPISMVQAARDARKSYTNIRIASVGVANAWLLIWENGEMLYDLDGKYPQLLLKLDELKIEGKGDEISWVVMNPFRAGDYFLYIDKDKMASFQVSENFGDELKKALRADGIETKDLILRTQEMVHPVKIHHLIADNIAEKVEKHVELNNDAIVNAATKVFKTAVVAVKAGAMIAGIVACTVM